MKRVAEEGVNDFYRSKDGKDVQQIRVIMKRDGTLLTDASSAIRR